MEFKTLKRKMSSDCYTTIRRLTIENWRRPVPNPVDLYIENMSQELRPYYEQFIDSQVEDSADSPEYNELMKELSEAARAAISAAKC